MTCEYSLPFVDEATALERELVAAIHERAGQLTRLQRAKLAFNNEPTLSSTCEWLIRELRATRNLLGKADND